MDIKPIETVYNGHKFRSRLEARWAVFFDTAGIKFEYELEGYDLGGGVRYLPDFFLPEFQLHVEVKPTRELTKAQIRKIILFAVDGGYPLLVIAGTPTSEGMYICDRTSFDCWATCDEEWGDDEDLLRNIFWEQMECWSHVAFGHQPLRMGWQLIYKTTPPLSEVNLEEALIKAKQARFEHGRRGN